ncbi:hypothetical protein [Streptomyces sp. NPDC046821]|uniref:hypothetical protein n=1 Tax=Streptomyces sp. NPDC046821 TaxID=3154702 RepID=UPI0033C75175
MSRIELAHWYRGHKPGSELDVTDVELRELRRDGRVARVVDEPQVAAAEPVEATETARKRR